MLYNSNINFPTRCNLCSDSLNKSAGLVSSFVDTTKIFCKLSGTLCQFNCLETLIFFKKLSTIRILFCSNDKCTLSIILKTNICDICIIKSSKKIICIHKIFINWEYHAYHSLGKSTYTAKIYKASKKW